MTSQYALYKQVHDSTGITHCTNAFFTAPARKLASGESSLPDLIVIRSNLLQIFAVRAGDAQGNAKLEVVGQWPLWGIVCSLVTLHTRFSGIQRDALLLTFREAKLVVLDWDDCTESIQTSSLHYFEDDVSMSGNRRAFAAGPQAIADPQGRCAAVIMMSRQVALLPAMDTEVLDARLHRSDTARLHPHNGLPATMGNACVLDLHKLGVRQVRDAAFLYRYNEPVLLLLHEAGLDWAGKARRGGKDGMALLALSINIGARRYPRLWAAERLPSDAMQLVPVRSGGALVLCQHLILFYTQGASCSLAVSARAYSGVVPAVLEFAEHAEAPSTSARRHAEKYATNMHPEAAPAAATGAPRAEGFDLDMAGAAAVWLSNNALLLSLASSQLVLLMLQHEGTLVRRLKVVDTGISTSPAAALTRLGGGLLFLGSFVGDSFLVHTIAEGLEPTRSGIARAAAAEAHKSRQDAGDMDATPPGKRQRLATPAEEDEDAEVSLIYRTADTPSASAGPNASKFRLKVADVVVSIGPVNCLAVGPLPSSGASSQKGSEKSRERPLVLAAVGTGKQGSLAVLRRGLLPHVITEVPLQGVRGVWGVRYWPQGLDWEPAFAQHAYLLIAEEHRTRILQAGGGDEDDQGTGALGQLEGEDVGFDTHRTTLSAGTLLNDSRIVQVCAEGFKVLAGTTAMQEVAVEALAPSSALGPGGQAAIAGASFCDPYLLLQLSSGHAVLLCANPDTGELGLVEEAPLALHGGGLAEDDLTADMSAASQITASTMFLDSAGWFAQHVTPAQGPSKGGVYAAVCRANGALEVFALPGMARVWAADDVADLAATLVAREDASNTMAGLLGRPPPTDLATVVEIRMECFTPETAFTAASAAPSSCKRALLVLRLSDSSMAAYRAFSGSFPGVRFAKLPLDLPLLQEHAPGMRLHRFDGLINAEADANRARTYSGLFVSGAQPCWLIASRGTVVMQPMDNDGAVVGFAPFHNPNCPNGFITLSASGALRICQLPARSRLDTCWPLQKHNQGATVQQVAFHQQSQLCVLLASPEGPYRSHLPEEEGGDPHASYAYAAANAAAKQRGMEASAEVRFVQPGSWATVWRHQLEAGEQGMALHSAVLRLCGEQGQLLPSTDTEPLLAVGTALGYGEDHPCTGRVVLFRVKPPPQGAAQGMAYPSGELAYSRLVQGPVKGLATVEGSLVVAYGNRIDLYAWTGSRLQRVAFYDTAVEVTCVTTIKSFLVYGDALKGLTFLSTAQGSRQLTHVSKDYSNLDISAAGTVVAGGKLGMVCSDAGGTVRLFAYSVSHPLMWRGKRLLPLGALHTGHYITSMVSGLRTSQLASHGRTAAKPPVMQASLGATSSGGIVCVAPMGDHAPCQALQALQGQLVKGQTHTAGLNPRAFRRRHRKVALELGGGARVGAPTGDHCILDGDLLWTYASLPRSRQLALASHTGATRDDLLLVLHELACSLLVV